MIKDVITLYVFFFSRGAIPEIRCPTSTIANITASYDQQVMFGQSRARIVKEEEAAAFRSSINV